MRKIWQAIKLAQVFLLFSSALSAEPSVRAPFAKDSELLHFSKDLMTRLGKAEFDAAEKLAQKNSHTDDAIAQQNLTRTFEELRSLMIQEHAFEIRYIERSAFGRSFIRHQYELQNSAQGLRCMLTYRRKTDGWRLSQLWCAQTNT